VVIAFTMYGFWADWLGGAVGNDMTLTRTLIMVMTLMTAGMRCLSTWTTSSCRTAV
jgi:hypothetical protein